MARVGIWLGLFLVACGGSSPEAKSADTTETTTTHDDAAPAASADEAASSKPSGDAKSNQELSERRAASVKKVLVDRYGAAEDRVVIKGAGVTQPVAGNESEDGKALNRRVEILLAR